MIYRFESFELDLGLYELRDSGVTCTVEPQVFDVLVCLISHRDRVVSKDQLLDEVWEGRLVSETALTSRIKTLRRVLGDSGDTQRFIKTVRGRGYRFISEVEEVRPEEAPLPAATTPEPVSHERGPSHQRGRGSELERLRAAMDRARAGARQMVFITGEAGLGKSTLVDAFVGELDVSTFRLAVGQCLQHQGPSEAYLPLLDALGELCRAPGGEAVVEVLTRLAPSWLLQLSVVTDDKQVAALRDRTQGAGPDRMVRELVEAMEALSASTPLVAVLEDLHWSDVSTVDVLSRILIRRAPARLMVIGTLRRADAERDAHPIAGAIKDLTLRRGAVELALTPLEEERVAELAGDLLPGAAVPQRLIELLVGRTRGHPLFVVAIVKAWRDGGALVAEAGSWRAQRSLEHLDAGVPGTTAELIDQWLLELSERERSVLEAASITGREFAGATVAAAAGIAQEDVEDTCDALTRRGSFLVERELATWPDGTLTARYAFEHELIQEALATRLPNAKRARFHRRIGQRLEAASNGSSTVRAGELAYHFRLGHDTERACRYGLQAARRSLQQFAYREAAHHVSQVLPLFGAWDGPHGREVELECQLVLSVAKTALEGYVAPGTAAAYRRAETLADEIDQPEARARVGAGLCRHLVMDGRLDEAREVARRLLDPKHGEASLEPQLAGRVALLVADSFGGRFASCLEHEDQVRELVGRSSRSARLAAGEGMLTLHAQAALARWMLGRPEAAFDQLADAKARGLRLGPSFALATVWHHQCLLLLMDGRATEAEVEAEALRELCERNSLLQWAGAARCLYGWSLAQRGASGEGVTLVRSGLDAWLATGTRAGLETYHAILSATLLTSGRPRDALAQLAEANGLIAEHEMHWNDALVAQLRAEAHQALGEGELARDAWRDALARTRRTGALLPRLIISERMTEAGRGTELAELVDLSPAAWPGVEPGVSERVARLEINQRA